MHSMLPIFECILPRYQRHAAKVSWNKRIVRKLRTPRTGWCSMCGSVHSEMWREIRSDLDAVSRSDDDCTDRGLVSGGCIYPLLNLLSPLTRLWRRHFCHSRVVALNAVRKLEWTLDARSMSRGAAELPGHVSRAGSYWTLIRSWIKGRIRLTRQPIKQHQLERISKREMSVKWQLTCVGEGEQNWCNGNQFEECGNRTKAAPESAMFVTQSTSVPIMEHRLGARTDAWWSLATSCKPQIDCSMRDIDLSELTQCREQCSL